MKVTVYLLSCYSFLHNCQIYMYRQQNPSDLLSSPHTRLSRCSLKDFQMPMHPYRKNTSLFQPKTYLTVPYHIFCYSKFSLLTHCSFMLHNTIILWLFMLLFFFGIKTFINHINVFHYLISPAFGQ